MKFIFKLVLLAVAIGALAPVLGPDTTVGKMVRAAWEDAGAFCDRRPEACEQGGVIARQTGDLIADTLAGLSSATSGKPLTAEDRALEPSQSVASEPDAASRKSSFAGHNDVVRY